MSPDPAVAELSRYLLDDRNQAPVDKALVQVTYSPGVYAVLATDPNCLPAPFKEHLIKRKHQCLYIGKTSSLARRLGYDLRGEGDSTFFCSLGLVLGYRPPPGSLAGKKEQNNFRFNASDASHIEAWAARHVTVASQVLQETVVEGPLIRLIMPLLNLKHNPCRLRELEELRKQARKIAQGISLTGDA